MTARPRLPAWSLAVLALLSLASCQAGSRSVSPEYYTIDFRTTQDGTGTVRVTGETDLPDGSQIDLLVSTPGPVDRASDRAILTGSTEEEGLSSRPVRNQHFTITTRFLGSVCGLLPPCGPFPAGRYLLLLDARTPAGPIGNTYTTFDDPHYLQTTHGTGGFTGIEIARELPLSAIRLCQDARGERRSDGCGAP